MGEAEVETLERGYVALNRGDLSVVLDLLDPDRAVRWEAVAEPETVLDDGG